MAKIGKKYQESMKLVDRTKTYDPEEAIKLIPEIAKANLMKLLNCILSLVWMADMLTNK